MRTFCVELIILCVKCREACTGVYSKEGQAQSIISRQGEVFGERQQVQELPEQYARQVARGEEGTLCRLSEAEFYG